jgi:hypothetical protein
VTFSWRISRTAVTLSLYRTMIVALLLLGVLALVSATLHRFGEHPKKNSPYHPLEHNSDYQDDDDE